MTRLLRWTGIAVGILIGLVIVAYAVAMAIYHRRIS